MRRIPVVCHDTVFVICSHKVSIRQIKTKRLKVAVEMYVPDSIDGNDQQ